MSIAFVSFFSTVAPEEVFSAEHETFFSVVRSSTVTGGQSGTDGVDGLSGKNGEDGINGRSGGGDVITSKSRSSVHIESNTSRNNTMTYVYTNDFSKDTTTIVSSISTSSSSVVLQNVEDIIPVSQVYVSQYDYSGNINNILKALSSIRLILLKYVGI